jgi:hypothetical protein
LNAEAGELMFQSLTEGVLEKRIAALEARIPRTLQGERFEREQTDSGLNEFRRTRAVTVEVCQ